MIKYQNRQLNIDVQSTDDLMIELSTDCDYPGRFVYQNSGKEIVTKDLNSS